MAADAGVDVVAAVAVDVAVGLASPPPRYPHLPQLYPQVRRPLLTADGTW